MDPTPPDSPAINDEFTQLTLAAIADPAAQPALWEAAHRLDHWHFLPRIEPGDSIDAMVKEGRNPGLVVVKMGDKPMVPVFTSTERAQEAAKTHGLAPADEDVAVLSVDRAQAVAMLCGLPGEVVGVIFNHNTGEQAFLAPLENVAAQEEMFHSALHPAALDRFARAVVAANRPEVWGRLHRHVLSREKWFMIADPGQPDRPVVVNAEGANHLLLFTEPERIPLGARALQNDSLADAPPIEIEPAQALAKWQAMHEQSGALAAAVFNVGTTPFVMTLEQLDAALTPTDGS